MIAIPILILIGELPFANPGLKFIQTDPSTVLPSHGLHFNVNLFPCGGPGFVIGPSPGFGCGAFQGSGQGGLGTCVFCEAAQESGQEGVAAADC